MVYFLALKIIIVKLFFWYSKLISVTWQVHPKRPKINGCRKNSLNFFFSIFTFFLFLKIFTLIWILRYQLLRVQENLFFFAENRKFWKSKFKFGWKTEFIIENKNFVKNWKFCQKLKILSKIENFVKNWKLGQK